MIRTSIIMLMSIILTPVQEVDFTVIIKNIYLKVSKNIYIFYLSGSKSANQFNPNYTPSKFPYSKAVQNTFDCLSKGRTDL